MRAGGLRALTRAGGDGCSRGLTRRRCSIHFGDGPFVLDTPFTLIPQPSGIGVAAATRCGKRRAASALSCTNTDSVTSSTRCSLRGDVEVGS